MRSPDTSPTSSELQSPARPARLYYRVPEVAEMLGISKSFAFKLVSQGELPSVRIGTAVRVPAEAIVAWARELEARSA